MLKTAELKEFDKPLITASYFGFTPIVSPKVTDEDIEAVSHCDKLPYFDAAEKAALIRTYTEQDFASLPHPLALIYKNRKGYGLHYIGIQGALAEAALIRTTLSILTEMGFKNLRVDLNCVGDKESLVNYERELISFVKKFGSTLTQTIKDMLKEDVFNLWRSDHEEAIQFRASAPASISFLSTQARSHFKEVLEFVEALGIEFGITPELIGEKNHATHTIFAIRPVGTEGELTGGEYLALGYRYSRLGKRLGLRKEVPLVGINIAPTKSEKILKVYKELPKPKFFLVQLGHVAKVRTLCLLELLRANRIPVHHYLGKDKLAPQLSGAETSKATHLLIIGHKEALDGTITVRNSITRAQDTVAMHLLPQYLKTLKL